MASVTPKKRPLAAARLCTEEAGDVRSPKRPSQESFTYSDGGANSDDETSLLFSLETEPTLGPLTDDMQDLAIRDDDGVERKIYDPRVVIEKKEVGDELQQKAIKLALDGENIFLTGKAGTGKSWTTKQLVKSFHEKSEVIHVTAPTGIAAININGVTIHSWGQFRLGEYYGDFDMMMEKKCRKKIKSSNALLIDEISMLDGQLFDVLECMVAIIRCYDLVEKRLKLIKEEPGSGNTIMSPLMLKLRWDTTSELGLCDIPPWGGLQIIVVGDFFQLPPIPKGHDVLIASNELMETDSHLKIGRQGSYAFESHAWHHSNFVTVELVQVHRQASSDVGLFEFLNAMREGEPDLASKHTATISALKAPLVERDDGIVPTELHSKNANVDAINQRELAKLRSTSHEFESLDEVVFCNEYKAKVLKKFGLDHISHMPYLFASVEKVPSPTPLVEARVKLKGIEGKMAQLIKIEDFEALMPLKKEKNSLKDSIELMEREEEQKQTINASSFGAFATGIDPRVTFDRYTCFKAHLIADHAVLAQHFRDKFFAKECRVSEEIEMKEGAQVMLLWNLDVKAGLANGSRGVLKAFWPTAGYYHLLRKELKSRNKNEGQNHAKRYEEYPAEEEAKCAMAKFEQCSKEEEARSAIVGGSNAGCSSNVSADITLMKGREENTPGDSSSEYDFSSFDEDHLNEITSHIGGMHVDFLQREIQEIGKIINLTHDLPYVRFTNGKERLIKPQPFSREIKNCGNASRWQIPLTLAWAISIHKSQGMTIEWLKINMKDCFAVGQAYVACSR